MASGLGLGIETGHQPLFVCLFVYSARHATLRGGLCGVGTQGAGRHETLTVPKSLAAATRTWRSSLSASVATVPSPSKWRGIVCVCALLAALSSVFIFGHERGHFYRPWTHNDISAQSMAVAASFAAEHRYLLFYSRYKNADGAPTYEVYNRYPFGTYLAINLAIRLASLPFGEDAAAQLYAARLLMLLFFAGAAVYAHLALCRITGRPEVALTATLLAFSSFYFLYYADMVGTEMPGLFAFMMVFHALVRFSQDDNLWPLCAKTAVAICLDWHPIALALVFVVFGTAVALVKHAFTTPRPAVLSTLWGSGYLRYGAFAALICVTVMGLQLGNEYAAFEGRVPLASLPTVESYQRRLLIDGEHLANAPHILDWSPFLSGQFQRLSSLALPFVVLQKLGLVWLSWDKCCHGVWQRVDYAAIFLLLSCVGIFSVASKYRLTMASLVAGGWCWALVLRASAGYHDFEALFFIGAPLVLYTAAATCVRLVIRQPVVLLCVALATVPLFVASAQAMATVGHFAKGYEFHRATMADVLAIRNEMPEGSSVCLPKRLRNHIYTDRQSAMKFFLAGRVVTIAESCADDDFTISSIRQRDSSTLLTPENRLLFLYRNPDP